MSNYYLYSEYLFFVFFLNLCFDNSLTHDFSRGLSDCLKTLTPGLGHLACTNFLTFTDVFLWLYNFYDIFQIPKPGGHATGVWSIRMYPRRHPVQLRRRRAVEEEARERGEGCPGGHFEGKRGRLVGS